jgi:acyl transferase domain-containing protein/acyl carrier protein
MERTVPGCDQTHIAVVGMSCRFPGAEDIREFWSNLMAGKESISTFSTEELLSAGVDPALVNSPNYVRSRGIVGGADCFDAAFFGYSPREAELLDPQHRIFLECAWHALEDVGYDPEKTKARIGVFGGTGTAWHLASLYSNPAVTRSTSGVSIVINNDKDYVTTRVSYKLGLRGPSINVQCACSTSLAAVVMGMSSLLNFQSDIILAGGATIEIPEKKGYLYQPGGMESPDGRCRTFDEEANGTVFSRGCGMVALKRLKDALDDGDNIYAVIRGGAINNDGNSKMNFTAPGVEGQMEVMIEALEMADTKPETIGYVEAHGTATPLGDPIEVSSLSNVFRLYSDRKQFCAIGSVKTNIGHTDVASGVAGLIKAALSVKFGKIVASLNFKTPNPKIDFQSSPFFVNTRLMDWPANGIPKRALVNSFGVGGTNVCVILEEPPLAAAYRQNNSRRHNLLLLSAKTKTALSAQAQRLKEYLAAGRDTSPDDLAYTSQIGRRGFPVRRFIVYENTDQLAATLGQTGNVYAAGNQLEKRKVVFMFPGQGNQYVNMALGLYRTEKIFRKALDECALLLLHEAGFDIREIIFPDPGREEPAILQLNQTFITQPALFIIEYALAMMWMSVGVLPDVMTGHSVGEYVAACISGVFSLRDAIRIVARRAKLVQQLPGGSMLAVLSSEKELRPMLPASVEIAVINTKGQCVLSGSDEHIGSIAGILKEKRIVSKLIPTSHAFHSYMMEPVFDDLRSAFRDIDLRAPEVPVISTVTGKLLTEEEARNPEYWIQHIRKAVRFSDAAELLVNDGPAILLELGPGRSLESAVKSHANGNSNVVVLNTLPGRSETIPDTACLLNAMGEVWAAGKEINWAAWHLDEGRRRISLPGYPFERLKYAIEPPNRNTEPASGPARKIADISQWFYLPSWKRTPDINYLNSGLTGSGDKPSPGCYLIFSDRIGLGAAIVEKLRSTGNDVILVSAGAGFENPDALDYVIDPFSFDDYKRLISEIAQKGYMPRHILHLWNYDGINTETDLTNIDTTQNLAFYSPLYVLQSMISAKSIQNVSMAVVVNGVYDITGERVTNPGKALAAGICRVTGKELTSTLCRLVDVPFARNLSAIQQLAASLIGEVHHKSRENIVAYRGRHRWTEDFIPVKLLPGAQKSIVFRPGCIYLVTGGLGGLGLLFARHIAEVSKGATIILLSRTDMPRKEHWFDWLETHHKDDETSRRLKAILDMEAIGSRVILARVDITNIDQLEEFVGDTERNVGPITGVIHSAGLVGGGVISLATAAAADEVLRPKVRGTLCLDAVFQKRDLEFLVLFSSITSILGEAGRMDYCSANSFMDAFACFRNGRSKCQTISLNWIQWGEVGMAARWEKAQSRQRSRPPGIEPIDRQRKLLERIASTSGNIIYRIAIQPDRDWVMSTHLLMNIPTLVGTAFIDLIYQFCKEMHPDRTPQLQNLVFISPLMVETGSKKKIRLVLAPLAAGYTFSFTSQQEGKDENADPWHEHLKGELMPIPVDDPAPVSVSAIRSRLTPYDGPVNSYMKFMDEAPLLELGARWDCLQKISLGTDEWLSEIRLKDEYLQDLQQHPIHPALADVALFASLAVNNYAVGTDFLPFRYEKICLYRPLTASLLSHSRLRKQEGDDDTLVLDVSLLDTDGTTLMEVEGYTLKKVRSGPRPAGKSRPAPAQAIGSASDSKDILPAEGLEAFSRIAASSPFDQVIICTASLPAMIEEAFPRKPDQVSQADNPSKDAAAYQRPELSTLYVEPGNEIEKTIYAIWKAVFGIGKIGIDDDFAELGGNSLLAVQMLANSSDAFNIEIPIDLFYKKPTIRGLSQIIIEQLLGKFEESELEELINNLEQ